MVDSLTWGLIRVYVFFMSDNDASDSPAKVTPEMTAAGERAVARGRGMARPFCVADRFSSLADRVYQAMEGAH